MVRGTIRMGKDFLERNTNALLICIIILILLIIILSVKISLQEKQIHNTQEDLGETLCQLGMNKSYYYYNYHGGKTLICEGRKIYTR